VWVVVALCLLVALTALLLCIPVDLGVRIEVYGRPVVDFTVGWLFGRVKKEFRSSAGRKQAVSAPAGKPAKAEKESGKRRTSGWRTARLVYRIVRIRGLLSSARRLVARTVRCFRLRTVSFDFRAGLDDPCDTAIVVGTLSSVTALVAARSRRHLRLSPALEDGPVLEGEADLLLRVFPICLVPPVGAFLFSYSTIRVLIVLIQWRLARK
jgi:hypothetical protein